MAIAQLPTGFRPIGGKIFMPQLCKNAPTSDGIRGLDCIEDLKMGLREIIKEGEKQYWTRGFRRCARNQCICQLSHVTAYALDLMSSAHALSRRCSETE